MRYTSLAHDYSYSMRHLLPFLTFFIIVNLIGCASHYREELQKELDLSNSDVMSQMEMGALSFSAAEQQIEDEWETKRELLANYNLQQQKKMNVFWDGFFATLRFGMALASSYVPIIPELHKMGDLALQSLKDRITQNPPPTVPPKTFALPPDFVHIYSSLDPQKGKTKIGDSFYSMKGYSQNP